MERRDNKVLVSKIVMTRVISTQSYSWTASIDHSRSADSYCHCVLTPRPLSAGHLSNSRSRLIVAASALKKPLTIFSSSSPGTGSSSKFPFLASAIKSGSFNVA